MNFEEAFEKLKASLKKSKILAGDGHFAIQVRITDFDCGGTFYVEQKDGEFFIEPYNYFDFDTDVEAAFKDFKAIADGKIEFQKAVEDGKVIVTGNYEAISYFANQLKKIPAKKAPAKTVAAKKSCKKSAPAKAETKTTAKKTTAKKSAAKSSK